MEEVKIDQNHIAIYIDLLGVSRRYEQNELGSLKRIHQIYDRFISHFKDESRYRVIKGMILPKATVFSDSLYISLPSEGAKLYDDSLYDYYALYMSGAAFLQAEMIIQENVFMRGGIASGINVYSEYSTSDFDIGDEHKDLLSVSSAFYKAVCEEKTAIYPIISTSSEIVHQIQNAPGKLAYREGIELPNSNLFFTSNKDGKETHFLNYLEEYIKDCLGFCKDSAEMIQFKMQCLESHKSAIINEYRKALCMKNKESLKVQLKYAWIAHEYHNIIVQKMITTAPNLDDGERLMISESEVKYPHDIESLLAP